MRQLKRLKSCNHASVLSLHVPYKFAGYHDNCPHKFESLQASANIFWRILLRFILPRGIAALSTVLSSHFCFLELHFRMELFLVKYSTLGSNSCICFFFFFFLVYFHISRKSQHANTFFLHSKRKYFTETDDGISRMIN